tara:strand:- start:9432 stop:10178 length:747 start_codon:yes stop_codon:yes gene_type:complete
MAVGTALAIGSGVVSMIGGAVAGNQASKAKGRAERAAQRARNNMDRIKRERITITNPYAGNTNLSGLATDLSDMISNPFNNLGVATQSAQIQMEQADIALANTLDTLATTGASAGGATALAQAALASKKGVSANLEQQEAQNQKLAAQGQQKMEQMEMQEASRIQSIQISEGQRMQQGEAAGQQFVMQMTEARSNADLDYAANQETQAMQNMAAANAAQAQAFGSAISGVTNVLGAVGSAPQGSMFNP